VFSPALRPHSSASAPPPSPGAEIRLFDTGHAALETHATEIARAIREFAIQPA
jgi:hypothetical protein